MTTTPIPTSDRVRHVDPPTPDARRVRRRPLVFVALLVAACLGFAGGWFAFHDGDEAAEPASDVPAGVIEVIDRFTTAFETNDYELLRSVVTPRFRRPFYVGDRDGSPWRDVYRIEAYQWMDDPNLSDADLVFYDIETVGDPIVRGDGPWYVSRAENWREGDRPNQLAAVHTYVVVEVDGAYLVDDALWVGTSVLADG